MCVGGGGAMGCVCVGGVGVGGNVSVVGVCGCLSCVTGAVGQGMHVMIVGYV